MTVCFFRKAAAALAAFSLTLLLSAPAFAQTMEDLRPEFMQGCMEDGESRSDCTCIFDGWAGRVAPDQVDTARVAIGLYLGEQPSSRDDIMAAMQMMQGLAGVAIQCAMGGAALPERMTIPGLGGQGTRPVQDNTGEEDGGDGDMAAGADILQQMMALEERLQARDAERDAEEQRLREAEDQRIMDQTRDLRAAHAAELERIHTRPIDAWAVSEFERLFTLYCQSGGGEAAECTCAWPILADLSTFNAVPYLASRSEGDDALQRLGAADFSAAFFTLREFNDRREVCDAIE